MRVTFSNDFLFQLTMVGMVGMVALAVLGCSSGEEMSDSQIRESYMSGKLVSDYDRILPGVEGSRFREWAAAAESACRTGDMTPLSGWPSADLNDEMLGHAYSVGFRQGSVTLMLVSADLGLEHGIGDQDFWESVKVHPEHMAVMK